MLKLLCRSLGIWAAAALVLACAFSAAGQTVPRAGSAAKYYDPVNGRHVSTLVSMALSQNAELSAMRTEATAAERLLDQARLRPNPTIEFNATRQVNGSDNSAMVQGEIPLELGGRRGSRIRIAEREIEIRRLALAERERSMAGEVMSKFAESLAAIFKLRFIEEMLTVAEQNYSLTSAKVEEGRTPPLERNQELVELNRIRALRETAEGAVEVQMFELRNLAGLKPDEPLRLRGTLDTPVDPPPSREMATDLALRTRPDLAGARAVELLAASKVEQAKSEGRVDADVMLGYQRMKSGFPLLGVQEQTGALLPIDSKFHFFTFGVKLMLPVRNRNQGMIAAARFEEDAARSRREFGELTIRREIASAYARYERAVKAREIYRVGVRDQASANLGIVRETYELGSRTLLDHIAEQRRFIDIETAFIDAQVEAYLARVSLLQATNSPELVNK